MAMAARYDMALDAEMSERWLAWTPMAAKLWFGAGFNDGAGLFHERLDFSLRHCDPPLLRLMPQMRQVASFARLARWDALPSSDRARWLGDARAAFEAAAAKFKNADGEAGWIFGIGRDDLGPRDKRRDLYAHAFVLYALAQLALSCRAHGRDAELHKLRARALAETLEAERLFHLPFAKRARGAPMEILPFRGAHAQNPYMHLLEAYMALADAFGRDDYRARIGNLAQFMRERLLGAAGLPVELFDAGWRPLRPGGQNPIEPGHLFEWLYLLEECAREAQEKEDALESKFTRLGIGRGLCERRGIVWDGVAENGRDIAYTARLWPQTEFLRWRKRAYDAGRAPVMDEDGRCLERVAKRMFKSWLPADLKGGWIDRMDKDGKPLVDYMPATSLYHALGAAGSWIALNETGRLSQAVSG